MCYSISMMDQEKHPEGLQEEQVEGGNAEIVEDAGETLEIEEPIAGAEILVTSEMIEEAAQRDAQDLIEAREELKEVKEPMSREEFERQLQQTETLEVGEEEIPFKTIIPEHPTKDEWVVFVGGFATSAETYVEEMYELASAGRKVMFVNPKQGLEVTENNKDLLKKLSVPDSIGKKAEALQAVLQEKGIEHADIIGHSQGAGVAAVLVTEHPEYADRLVLNNPIGLLEKDSRLSVMGRAAKEVIREGIYGITSALRGNTAPFKAWMRGVQGADSLAADAKYTYGTEIPGATKVDLIPILENLRDQRAKKDGVGPEVILLTSNKDRLMPTSRVEKTVVENDIVEQGLIDQWSSYIRKDATHGAVSLEQPGVLSYVLGDTPLPEKEE